MYRLELKEFAEEYLQNAKSAHDFIHHSRVWNIAWYIHKKEDKPIDLDVLYAASLLHDTGYLIPTTDDPKFANHPIKSMLIAEEILPEVGFPEEKIPAVLEAIRLHDATKPWGNKEPTDKREIWYLQDADCLEAHGVLGMLRIAEYSFGVKMPLFKPYLPFYSLMDGRESLIHNFIFHLNIEKRLNTETAKELAKSKEKDVVLLIEAFLRDWDDSEELVEDFREHYKEITRQ